MNSYSNSSHKLCFEVSTYILSWGTQILYMTPATLSSIYDITNEHCPFLLLIVHLLY